MSFGRMSGGSGGVIEYLENGQKQGRELTRDELDERVYLGGDIEDARDNIKQCQEKELVESYKHYTTSYRDDEDVSIEKMAAIAEEGADFFCAGYELGVNVAWYSEAHLPKVQSLEDKNRLGDHTAMATAIAKANGGSHTKTEPDGRYDRFKHSHTVLPKLDKETGKALQLRPYSIHEHTIFQSYIAKKYGVLDPKDNPRSEPDFQGKVQILSRVKGDLEQATQRFGNRSEKAIKRDVMKDMCAELTLGARSTEEALEILRDNEYIESARYVDGTTGRNQGNFKNHRYIEVKFKDPEMKDMNLRSNKEETFEHLAKLHYTEKDYQDRRDAGLTGAKDFTLEELTEMVNGFKITQMKHVGLRGEGNARQRLEEIVNSDEYSEKNRLDAQKALKEVVKSDNKRAEAKGNNVVETPEIASENPLETFFNNEASEMGIEAKKQDANTPERIQKTEMTQQEKLADASKRYDNFYSKMNKEQRTFHVIYNNKVSQKTIQGYKLFKQVGRQHIENKNTGSKIIDDLKSGNIFVNSGRSDASFNKSIEMTAKIVLSKGFTSKTVDIEGSSKFTSALKEKIEALETKGDYKVVKKADRPESLTVKEHKDVINTKASEAKSDTKTQMEKSVLQNLRDAGLGGAADAIAAANVGSSPTVVTITGEEDGYQMARKLEQLMNDFLQEEQKKAKAAEATTEDNSRSQREMAKALQMIRLLMVGGANEGNYFHFTQHNKFIESASSKTKNPSYVSSQRKMLEEKIVAKSNKELANDLKTELKAEIVVSWAKEKYGLRDQFFEITEDNKINDTRNDFAPKTTIDFVTRTLNIPAREAFSMLNDMLEAQRESLLVVGASAAAIRDAVADAEDAENAEIAEEKLEEGLDILDDQIEVSIEELKELADAYEEPAGSFDRRKFNDADVVATIKEYEELTPAERMAAERAEEDKKRDALQSIEDKHANLSKDQKNDIAHSDRSNQYGVQLHQVLSEKLSTPQYEYLLHVLNENNIEKLDVQSQIYGPNLYDVVSNKDFNIDTDITKLQSAIGNAKSFNYQRSENRKSHSKENDSQLTLTYD